MSTTDRIARRIADHWDRRTEEKTPNRTKWWQSREVRRHINQMVSGERFEGTGEGLVHVLKDRLEGRILKRGVSVGCGFGNKEMRFIRLGMVKHFDLFELSESRIEKGRMIAENLGVADQVQFHRENAFEVVEKESVDLVHWNNSLHHMLDVRHAVEWSRRVLVHEGNFFMDDFVGPSRFQWSDRALAVATGVRALLHRSYLRNPHSPPTEIQYLPIQIARPSARRIARDDPSEAAESDQILAAVLEFFPAAEIQRTGGLVYHLALSNVLQNFNEDDPDDIALLRVLLELDKSCLADPDLESPYATALAIKR